MGASMKITIHGKKQHQLDAERQTQAEAHCRRRRNELLAESDWTQVTDAPVDKSAWADYRRALRDIPSQPGFPDAIEWPAFPEKMH